MPGKQYTTAPLLVNADGHPIPQYLDTTDTTDSPQGTFKPLFGKFGSTDFIQRGTIAAEAWEGNESITMIFDSDRYGFSVVNDGEEDLTFIINDQTRRVKPGEAYYALFEPFTEVEIVANSFYRAEVLK